MRDNHKCKDTENLLKKLVTYGFRYSKNGIQVKVYAPDGINMTTIHIGSNGRSLNPLKSWSRRYGANI